MKMAKRIFIGVLVIAVMASCLVFAGTAATKEYTIDNYSEILEYYESPVMFGYNFEDETVGEAYSNNVVNNGKAQQTVTIQEDENGKFLQFMGGQSNAQCGDVFFYWNGESAVDNFFFDFVVSGTTTGMKVSVYNGSDEDNAYFGGANDCVLLGFNFNNGTGLTYYDAATNKPVTVEGFTLNKDAVYNVSIKYSGSKGTHDFVVTSADDETVTTSMTGLEAPFDAIQNVKIGAARANMQRKALVKLYDVSAYAGSFKRNPNDIQPETEAAVIDMKTLFDDLATPYEDKIEIATIIIKLKTLYGFESDAYVPEQAYNDLIAKSVLLYADELGDCIDAIDTEAAYVDRLANVEAYARYVELMPLDCLFYVDTEISRKVKSDLEKYYAEVEAVESIKYNCDAFIESVASIDPEVVDYDTMTAWYENVNQYTPYDQYDGIPEAKETFAVFSDRYVALEKAGTDFVTATAIFADLEKGFGDRYAAYLVALANLYTEETYPGIDTFHLNGTTYTDARASYEAVVGDMLVDVEYCESFISNVSSADYALYIVAKENFINAAAEIIDKVEAEYPGMTDAIALYETLVEDIKAEKKAAADYIAAVEATDGLVGMALVEAVEKALELQVTGNIPGIEGVTDANIILSNLVVSTELEAGYSNQLVYLVAQIKDAKTLSEKYSLIVQALSVKDRAVDEYEGVTAAKTTLDAAVAEYKATVKAMNEAFVSANSNAVEVCFGWN